MDGYTYCILDGVGHAKVGKSVDPMTRLAALQGANAHKLILHGIIEGQEHEARLHAAYHFLRVPAAKEWFQATTELLAEFGPPDALKSFVRVPIPAGGYVDWDEECDGNKPVPVSRVFRGSGRYDLDSIMCPTCVDASAFLEEAFYDFKRCIESEQHRGSTAVPQQFLTLLMRGQCGHRFEIRIDHGPSQFGLKNDAHARVEVYRLVSTQNLVGSARPNRVA